MAGKGSFTRLLPFSRTDEESCMNRIFLKSTAVAFSSLLASLLLALTLVPALGGVVDGYAWMMLTICPLALAWPARL